MFSSRRMLPLTPSRARSAKIKREPAYSLLLRCQLARQAGHSSAPVIWTRIYRRVPTNYASEWKEDGTSMFGLRAELAAAVLFGSLSLAPSQFAGKQDPAKSYGQNLAAASEAVSAVGNGGRSKWRPKNCLPGAHRRPLPGPRKRCAPPKAQPAGPF